MLEFDASVWGCEVPVGLGFSDVSVVLPCGDFIAEGVFVGDAAVEALGRQNAEFGLRQIESAAMLWGVVPFETFDRPPGFGGREGLVE